MRKHIGRVFFGLALFLVLALPPVASAQITEVRMGVDGLVEGRPAAEVKKALLRLEGVENVQVRAERAEVIITLKSGWPVEMETLREAVVKGKLTPTWIRFSGVGLLTLRQGSPGFDVLGTHEVIPLEDDTKFEELAQVARWDCDLVFIQGLIPRGEKNAQIERFELTAMSTTRC